jgi:hypothetical protein
MRFLLPLISLTLIALLGPLHIGAEEKSKTRKDIDQALDKIEVQINDLSEKASRAKGKAKDEWSQAVAEFNKRHDQVKKEIVETEKKSEVKTKDYWARIKAALSELESGIKAAGKRMSSTSDKQKPASN